MTKKEMERISRAISKPVGFSPLSERFRPERMLRQCLVAAREYALGIGRDDIAELIDAILDDLEKS